MYTKTGLRPDALDEDAVKIVGRLRRKGHEAYLVGGCVRDLLLNRIPKDFDIATSARPRQIKALFRNCRIIGRRFKLAHLHFEGKIIEVSTFRRRPEPDGEDGEDLLIRSDNVFGSAEEDALRRDFTINALLFCPGTDSIHDFTGGIADLTRGMVRTIGDPLVRIKEDPVRILRAIKFASRLNLEIEAGTWKAMCEASGDLVRSAPPRVLEEILRLLRTGTSLQAFQLLRQCGALEILIPELSSYLASRGPEDRLRFWRLLEALDSRTRQLQSLEPERAVSGPSTPVILGCLLLHLLEKERSENGARESDLGRIVEKLAGPILKRMNVSRAESGRLKRICVVQRRFQKGGKARSFRPETFLRQDYFPEALELVGLRCLAGEGGWEAYHSWAGRYRQHLDPGAPGAKGRARETRSRAGKTMARSPGRQATKPARKAAGRKDGRTRRKPDLAPTLAPVPEVALDPKVVPTYGSVLGDTGSEAKVLLESSKGKRTRKKLAQADEPYSPPPPPPEEKPGSGSGEEDPDVFGDW